ncbi:MAG: hypothetical protein KJP25_00810 [Gammaproteobacteria bacterium]|nr:hypothetical protein [Gammaproteobacteria bacterium]MBT8150610.1 hypothetical protein [Gammaproteobacteria bacterium]NND38410.1 hypothetical protein [Pseudomonadales bacterium]NNM12093.1 hypothetical protein [Pseudomonadales bacterium]RZV58837.1 MAG: hypothetical protein EX270_02255 [Pseudomonadales bacterium]
MKITAITILCLSLIGCAGIPTQPLSNDAMSNLKGKSLALVQRNSPSFIAMTSGKGMFAVAGVGAATVAGNKLVEEAEIVDPAKSIGDKLSQKLAAQHGVSIVKQPSAFANSDSVNEIVQIAAGADYALDVVTNGWSYMYDGFKFSDYFVGYSARLRLIDVNTSKVLASGMCIYDAKKASRSAVSHDFLLKNDAAYIKQELSAASDECVKQFSSTVL